MKRIFMRESLTFSWLLVLALTGCTHGIHSGTGGWPPASSTPAGISSSADVVTVRSSDVSMPAGSNADATVTLSISSIYLRNSRRSAGVITFDATVGEEYGARPWHAQHALAVRICLGVFPVQRLHACVNALTS